MDQQKEGKENIAYEGLAETGNEEATADRGGSGGERKREERCIPPNCIMYL